MKIFPPNEYSFRVENTEYEGHERNLAAIAVREDYEYIVVVGGDGTVHNVVQELVFTNVCLCIVPTTPGSAFAHFSGIPKDPIKALELIKTDNIHYFDVGRLTNNEIGELMFLNNFGINFSATLAKLLSEKSHKSIYTFYKSAFKSYRLNNLTKFKVRFNYFDKEYSPYEFLISNIDQYGCKIKLFPYVNAQDGVFDILELKQLSLLRYIQLLFMFYFTSNEEYGDIMEYHKAEDIDLFFEERTQVQLDCVPYELIGETNISMLTQALRIIVPISFLEKIHK